MVHRFALFIGGVGAAAVLALAMNLGGLFSAAPTAANDPTAVNSDAQATAAPDQKKTVIDKVYVAPTPNAPVTHVNRPPRNTRHPRGDGGDRGGD